MLNYGQILMFDHYKDVSWLTLLDYERKLGEKQRKKVKIHFFNFGFGQKNLIPPNLGGPQAT